MGAQPQLTTTLTPTDLDARPRSQLARSAPDAVTQSEQLNWTVGFSVTPCASRHPRRGANCFGTKGRKASHGQGGCTWR